jgi:hypothetical protein
MADVAKLSAAAVATSDEAAKTKTHVEKPEKPDDAEYKKGLAMKEKEHKIKQDAYVGFPHTASKFIEQLRLKLYRMRSKQSLNSGSQRKGLPPPRSRKTSEHNSPPFANHKLEAKSRGKVLWTS